MKAITSRIAGYSRLCCHLQNTNNTARRIWSQLLMTSIRIIDSQNTHSLNLPIGRSYATSTDHTKRHYHKSRSFKENYNDAKHRALESVKNTQRYYMYMGLRKRDVRGTWRGFIGSVNGGEWDKLTEYDIIQVMRLLNKKYHFDKDPEVLMRLKRIIQICDDREFKFTSTWAFNETIRVRLAERRRDLAYWIKKNMDSSVYGPRAKTNIFTYDALFSDPFIETPEDLVRLTQLYDELLRRGFEPNVHVQKPLIRAARVIGEKKLLEALLSSSSVDKIPYRSGVKGVRFAAARSRAHLELYKLNSALQELEKAVRFQLPKDIRNINLKSQTIHDHVIHIPMEQEATRESFFIYLRHLYEMIVYTYLLRNSPDKAFAMFDEMRRDCFIPPTQQIYGRFIKYFAKRKDIGKLWDIRSLMIQDGVPLNETFHTKFITSCMFTPKSRLLNTFAQRLGLKIEPTKASDTRRLLLGKGGKGMQMDRDTKREDAKARAGTNSIGADGHDDGGDSAGASGSSGLPPIPEHVKTIERLNAYVFYPDDCIRFFTEMLSEYSVDINDLKNTSYTPNVSITNAVMHAYMLLNNPKAASREFSRYCIHQKRLYPFSRPPDATNKRRSVVHVVKMALRASIQLKDKRLTQRIYTLSLSWGIKVTVNGLID